MVDFRRHVDKILNFGLDKFGEQVTFLPADGGVYHVRAVFDNEHAQLDLDTEQFISVNQPRLGVNLNSLPEGIEIKQGDVFRVRAIRYRVQDKREDGQGGALILLQKERVNDRIKDTRATN